MRHRILFIAVLALALGGLGCATTQGGADAGPPGPPTPSEKAVVISSFVSAGLSAAEPGLSWGVEYAADQGQTARCYVLLGLETLVHVGGNYAASVPASGKWLSRFDRIEVNPSRCNPLGPPKVSPETAATVDKLCKALVPPVVAITQGVLSLVGVPCGWRAWAEGIETEVLALPAAITNALAGEPFVLPEVVLRTCPEETPPPATADPLPHPAAVGG